MTIPHPLEQLYAFAREAGESLGLSPEGVLDPCGLLLEIPPQTGYCSCTPTGAKTFARTGGDGVHYSYFDLEAQTDARPIVMTLPAAEPHNLVVAESFEEFFGLGYHVGWFPLEQILGDPAWAVDYFAAPDPDDSPEDRELLEALRLKLGIRYVPLSVDRVTALTAKYAALLQLPGDLRRDPAVDCWFDARPTALSAIAREWFDVLRACGPNVSELLHRGRPTVCIGDAAFAYVDAFRSHVSVGFFNGAELADPAGLLEGRGRLMRHVKLRPGRADGEAALLGAALFELILAAHDDMRQRLDERQG